jgi:hypothetical protein
MHAPTTNLAGIDWASRSHAVCVIDGSGSVFGRRDLSFAAVTSDMRATRRSS